MLIQSDPCVLDAKLLASYINDFIARESQNLSQQTTERETLLLKIKIADAKILRGRIRRELTQ
jgi:hypothetical protein